MSVAAFGHHDDPHDVSFESFIDADAIADHKDSGHDKHQLQQSSAVSSTSSSATTASTGLHLLHQQHPSRSDDSIRYHHMSSSLSTSLPNTPKLASFHSFEGGVHHHDDSALNHLSFEWDDMSGHHHAEALSQQALVANLSSQSQADLHGMPGLAYDSTSTPSDESNWSSATGRRSLDDFGGQNSHASYDGASTSGGFETSGLHGRPASLHLHDVTCSTLGDDLIAQAPPPSRGQHPFIKMEQHDHMPFEDAHLQSSLQRAKSFEDSAAAYAAPNGAAASPPSEKRRRLEQNGDAERGDDAGNTKSSTLSKKSATNKSRLSQSGDVSLDGAAEDQSADCSMPGEADESLAQSAHGGEDVEDDVNGESKNDGNSVCGGHRKTAPKGKKPPPSASQFTESGKPFPVIDTSAAHSSLFVPPDTSGLTKREARLVKNRAAAFLSRQRKREQFELLEKQCKSICRLTWKMWETIAGPDAEVSALEQTILPALFAEESPDIRDCLEQIVNNKGASIAPTEESMANGTHSSRQDSSPPRDTHTSPPRAAAVGVKREREDGDDTGERSVIEKLRSELAAAQRREIHLRTTLAEERSCWSSSVPSAVATPADLQVPASNSIRPFYPTSAANGLGHSTTSSPTERVFREGRSAGSGLSLTIAPQLTAADVVDAAITPVSAYHSSKRDGSMDDTSAKVYNRQQNQHSRELNRASSQSPSSTGTSQSTANSLQGTTRRATSSMALMVLLFGFALFGSGSLTTGSGMPKVGITRLPSVNGAFSSIGSLFDPLATSGGPDHLGFLHRKEEDEDDEEMDNGDGRPSSHLSASDLALHIPASVASQLDEVADMLPLCSLDDSQKGSDDVRRALIERLKHRVGNSPWKDLDGSQHMENAFILIGDDDTGTLADDGEADFQSLKVDAATPTEDPAPRKLKLFLARSRQAACEHTVGRRHASPVASSRSCSIPTSPTAVSSPSSSHSDDVFEDANVRTPTSSVVEFPPMPSTHVGRSGKAVSDFEEEGAQLSFLELEFSLSGKRFVRDEVELANLLEKAAAQHQHQHHGPVGVTKPSK